MEYSNGNIKFYVKEQIYQKLFMSSNMRHRNINRHKESKPGSLSADYLKTPTLFIADIALVAPFMPVEIEVLAYNACISKIRVNNL